MVWHDNGMQGNKAPKNECLGALLGAKETADWDPGRWRGSLLVNAYRYRLEEMRDRETDERTERMYVPVDVDTMALGPVLAFVKWRSRPNGEYGLVGTKTEGSKV